MFLQSELGWLSGIPGKLADNGIHWLPLAEPGGQPIPPMVIDREVLHRAARTHRTLLERFPRALPLSLIHI